jgi:phage terminase large subunit GpA-like protein
LYSPWRKWADVAADFLASKDHPEQLKTWVNTSLGETWEDREGDSIDATALQSRREETALVPAGVAVITAGVDVQNDRLEISCVGWFNNQSARVLSHRILYGDPAQPDVWSDLDTLLLAEWTVEDDSIQTIRSVCVDTGGHHTQSVYAFCKPRQVRRVWAIKGRAGAHPVFPMRASRVQKGKMPLYHVGVDSAKNWIKGAFAVKDPKLPHYISFADGLDASYFRQLTAERRKIKYSATGAAKIEWVKPSGARNEAWDCLVYAYAALEGLKMGGFRLKSASLSESRGKTIPHRKSSAIL